MDVEDRRWRKTQESSCRGAHFPGDTESGGTESGGTEPGRVESAESTDYLTKKKESKARRRVNQHADKEVLLVLKNDHTFLQGANETF